MNADPWAAARLRRCAHRVNFFHGVAGKYDLDAPSGLPMGFEYYSRVAFITLDRMRRYLQRLRICASVNDVIDRRTNLSALAQALGYASHSHFDEAFRTELRVTPAELRRIAVLPRLTQMRHALHSQL